MGLTFLQPWVLAALVTVPLLWHFLRAMPPAERRMPFPGLVLLASLKTREYTPDTMPLWLAILRMIIVISFILGLAQPMIGSAGNVFPSRPLAILFDDSWASARGWDDRLDIARQAITEAERGQNPIMLLTISDILTGDSKTRPDSLTGPRARERIAALSPQPWRYDGPAPGGGCRCHGFGYGPVRGVLGRAKHAGIVDTQRCGQSIRIKTLPAVLSGGGTSILWFPNPAIPWPS